MIIRVILYIILFYLIYSLVRKAFRFIAGTQTPVKGASRKKVRNFDPDDIEDIDYQEVKKTNDD